MKKFWWWIGLPIRVVLIIVIWPIVKMIAPFDSSADKMAQELWSGGGKG